MFNDEYLDSIPRFRDEFELLHVGVGHEDDPPGRGSGRYGWGSGENPFQHQFDFLSEVKKLRGRGLKDADIAKMLLGERATTTNLRAEIAIQTKTQRQANRARVLELYDECHGNVSEVARRMSNENKTWNESTIRSLLNPVIAERTDRYENTANFLKDKISKKRIIDVSSGTELYMGITDSTKKVAIAMLEKEGYVKAWVQVPQLGTEHKTSIMVLAPPDTTYSEIYKNRFNIQSIQEFTPDKGKTWFVPEYPKSLDSKRVMIRYAEEGGKDKDGVIELRRGVEDISLGGSQYAQVRVMVDDTHYMKGMAMYAADSDFPKGIDVIYNTNKHIGTPMKDVMKPCKINQATGKVDKDNPFGALIKAGGQRKYTDANGKEQLSPINKLSEEGDWDTWSRNLASQFLSKQPLKLINQQLELSVQSKRNELTEILNLTNPVIKKKLLEDFANQCDANAADLSAKGFRKQAFQVLLPIPSMKDTDIYAPNFQDGDMVALVRYPHGGTFEIPILKVNNKNAAAKAVMKNARDAVGINPAVAERLSGADFDGDTALVIPMTSNRIKITSTPKLKGLVDFDAKEIYKLPDDAPQMKNSTKQNQMGQVTNLITDMTVGGASLREIEKAVRHSMVVIDAEKHHLDYKQSAIDNDVRELKKKYQGRVDETTGKVKTGASTILSRASAEVYVDKRKEVTDTSKMTEKELADWNEGKKVYRPTGEKKKVQITDPSKMTKEELEAHKAGKKVYRESNTNIKQKVSQMETVDDARKLVHDPTNQKEMAYANYANDLKSMANEARREARSIKPIPVSQEAKNTYAKEVQSLNSKLINAQKNSPRERQAQIIANSIVEEKFASNPDMDYEHRQRERSRALTQARAQVGAKKDPVVITDREWEAIQANAISTNKLAQILNNTDQELFRQRATPRTSSSDGLSDAQLAMVKSMVKSGLYTNADIAAKFGISASYVSSLANS